VREFTECDNRVKDGHNPDFRKYIDDVWKPIEEDIVSAMTREAAAQPGLSS
jgi:hypothetical protein